ncbi:hypothetical protein EO087_12885 [Dyella sp. M7H15-1]|uniref:hypothetical protein n=1 Tax=Dyella sp. M7H15-1 TaxID=2501295 RepID=UPI001004DF99|nr:hypothetical protein [Dyella sp. M7H15-1]QAU24772.1 hypothetical protein EO087_12885 [Dyella sp. M7H15-1]
MKASLLFSISATLSALTGYAAAIEIIYFLSNGDATQGTYGAVAALTVPSIIFFSYATWWISYKRKISIEQRRLVFIKKNDMSAIAFISKTIISIVIAAFFLAPVSNQLDHFEIKWKAMELFKKLGFEETTPDEAANILFFTALILALLIAAFLVESIACYLRRIKDEQRS